MPLFAGVGVAAAAGSGAAFGGATAGASIMAGTIGAASTATVGAGIGLGTAATIGTAAAAGGGILAAISSYMPYAMMGVSALSAMQAADSQEDSGDAARATAEYNARINELNAQLLDDEAKAVKDATDYKIASMAREHRRFLSIQKTRYAKAGVVLDSGSPLLNLNETAYLSAMDRAMVGEAGEVEATSLTNRANILRSNAEFARYTGSIAQDTAKKNATSTLISGLGKIGASYLSLKSQGRYKDYF